MKLILSISCLSSLFFAPEAAFSEYYLGTEYSYYTMEIEKIEALSTPPGTIMLVSDLPPGTPYIDLFPPPSIFAGQFTEVQLFDIYPDHYNGASIFVGYKFKAPLSIEVGIYKSEEKKGKLNVQRGDVIYAESNVSVESLRVDFLGYLTPSNFDRINFIGSVGVVAQKLNASTHYLQQCFEVAASCPPFQGSEETSIDEARVQMGMGVSYELNEKLSLRGTVKFIPGGFSYNAGTPYSLNIGLLYDF